MENNKYKAQIKHIQNNYKKFHIDMDNKFRELAAKRGIAKSQMILFAMGWYLDYSKSMDLMPKMLEALRNAEEITKQDKE